MAQHKYTESIQERNKLRTKKKIIDQQNQEHWKYENDNRQSNGKGFEENVFNSGTVLSQSSKI